MSAEYWVFCYDDYYPSGGMQDLVSRHRSEDEALEAARQITTTRSPAPSGTNVEIWRIGHGDPVEVGGHFWTVHERRSWGVMEGYSPRS